MLIEWKKNYFVFCLIFVFSDIQCSECRPDKYVTSSKAECLSAKSWFSCIKYKTARLIWSVAIGRNQLNKNLFNSERFNLVRIDIGNDEEDNEYPEYRYEQDESETSKALSFLKRSVHMFLAAHGFQISFDNDIKPRQLTDGHSGHFTAQIRGERHRHKHRLKHILPLLIILKMAAILQGIGGIQLMLIGGGFLLYQTLRNCANAQTSPQSTAKETPQCKSSPVTMRSSTDEPEPSSSSYIHRYDSPLAYHSSLFSAKDWANDRAYGAYNLDRAHPALE